MLEIVKSTSSSRLMDIMGHIHKQAKYTYGISDVKTCNMGMVEGVMAICSLHVSIVSRLIIVLLGFAKILPTMIESMISLMEILTWRMAITPSTMPLTIMTSASIAICVMLLFLGTGR